MTLTLTILIIFAVTSLIEFAIIYFKLSELKDLHSVGKMVTPIIGVDEKYNSAINWVVDKFVKFKKFIWIPIVIIGFLNLIASSIVGTILYFVCLLISNLIK